MSVEQSRDERYIEGIRKTSGVFPYLGLFAVLVGLTLLGGTVWVGISDWDSLVSHFNESERVAFQVGMLVGSLAAFGAVLGVAQIVWGLWLIFGRRHSERLLVSLWDTQTEPASDTDVADR